MIYGRNPTSHDINLLPINEKQIYDRLIYLANLNKLLPHTKDKTIQELKHRMKLIEGELEAGNDNLSLFKELYKIAHALNQFKVITKKQLTMYLEHFKYIFKNIKFSF